jgi:hypothetical protein
VTQPGAGYVRIMTRRTLGSVLLACGASVLVGCASTTAGTPTSSVPAGAQSSSTSSSSSPAVSPIATALFARVSAGLKKATSLHVAISTTLGGETITAAGDEALANGTLAAADITENIPGQGGFRLIIVNDKTYAQLPAAMNHSGKPWVLVSTSSANPLIRGLAATLDQVKSSASVTAIAQFAPAATGVTDKGSDNVGGVPATHYGFTVQVAKLPSTFPGKAALQGAGLVAIPVELWVDAQGRPVKITQRLAVAGQASDTTVLVSGYDKPVHIVAPPADQVSTD